MNTLQGEALHLPASLWAQTAVALERRESLQGEHRADVVIVGAGFTGLAAAIHLAEAGKKVIVLDAVEPGWGASGRNNGQVIAGLKQDPDSVEARFPGETGRKMVAFSSSAPQTVFDLIDKYQMPCHAVHRGWIQPAFCTQDEALVQKRVALWQVRGVDAQLLQGEALHARLGTDRYRMGWLDPRGGSVQPLSYARSLANTAMRLGVSVCCDSRVLRFVRDAVGFRVQTAQGSVTADAMMVATGAYADRLVSGLATSFVAVRTAQIASHPLPAGLRARILPDGQVASDTRQLLTSFRLSPDGRLVMGGSGATAGLRHDGVVPCLQKAGEALFGNIDWAYQWSGYFAVTTDHLPHIHEPQDNLHIAVGCNGRGIAISTALGMALARRVLGAVAEDLPVPLTTMRRVPFHAFRHLGVAAATRYKRWQDKRSKKS